MTETSPEDHLSSISPTTTHHNDREAKVAGRTAQCDPTAHGDSALALIGDRRVDITEEDV